MQNDADRPLVEACSQGDEQAFAELYTKYHRKIAGFARKFVRDEHLAEDIVQEVFFQVHRKLHLFRGDARFSTWLFRVTINACKSKTQALDRQRRYLDERVVERLHQPITPTPEAQLAASELKDHIDEALDSLTEEQRSILLMKTVRELSYVEIGRAINQSETQVRGKLYRARKAFRSDLDARRAPSERKPAA